MLKSVAILMMVHTLGGGDRPEVVLVPSEVMGDQACEDYRKSHDANLERVMNTFSERPIISSSYACAFLTGSMLDDLRKN